MPKIDESDLEVGNEPPFVARKVAIKKGQNAKLDYSFADELGRGRFGTVVKCTEKKTGLKLAAKFVSTRMKEERENVEREVDIMKSLQHRRLLQLYDVYDDGQSEICIITELINGGELFERVIDDDFELTEKICSIFMRQIIEGVQYMHEKLIMHLDMKPENILCVSRTGNRIKLIDFGLARRFDPARTLQVMFGTPDFAAPEVLSYERVTPAADMWSVGVICYVLLSGLSPFMGNSDLETMTNVTRAHYDFDDDSFDPISPEAKDFIAKLLIKDASKRLKPNECLQHKWLAKTPARKGKVQQLDKTKLKKYVVRRRWQKAVTAIMALTRMGANLSLTSPSGRAPVAPRTPVVQVKSSGGTAKSTSSTTTRTSSSSSRTSSSSTSASPRTTRIVTTSTSSPAAGTGAATTTGRSTITTHSSSTSSYSSGRLGAGGGASAASVQQPASKTTINSASSSPNSTHSALSSNSRFSGLSSPNAAAAAPSSSSSPIGRTSSSSASSTSYRIQSSTLATTRRRF